MRRGFTLVELLAVIVILAIIALIAVPIVINIINDTKKSSQEESFKLYAKAVENAVTSYLMKNSSTDPTILKIDDIKDYIKYSGEKIDCETLQIGEKGEIYLADCIVNKAKTEYTYGEKLYPKPELSQGLTPVIYDGNNWKIVDKNDKDWYDYDKQKWANAVVLKSGSTKTIGDIVTVEGNNPDVLMMYVWIPRYEYKIEGQYGKHSNGTNGTESLPGEVEINFISKNTITPTEGYHINNAFTFDGEKSGFWVGKFELSHITLSLSNETHNLQCENGANGVICDSDSREFRILPNVKSLRKNNVSNFWYGIKKIENTTEFGLSGIDIHMIKNSEWGAVAYLSQSKYGKYGNEDYDGAKKETYINNSEDHYTGRSGGNIGGGTPINETYTNQTSVDQYNTYGYYTYDGYLLEYNTNNKTATRDINKGTGASTTGNIYGVYDMNGGAWEYVMGAYGTEEEGLYSGYNLATSSDFNGKTGNDHKEVKDGLPLPDSKYYDFYKTDNAATACNNGVCYGHAMSETKKWYVDKKNMVSAYYPWFVRSCEYASGTSSGIFCREAYTGRSLASTSTRVVGIVR